MIATLLMGAAVVYPYFPLRYGVPVWSLGVDLLRPVWGVGFGLLLALAVQARPIRSRILLRLGLVSYGIYLYHAVVLAFLERHWVPLHEQGLAALPGALRGARGGGDRHRHGQLALPGGAADPLGPRRRPPGAPQRRGLAGEPAQPGTAEQRPLAP